MTLPLATTLLLALLVFALLPTLPAHPNYPNYPIRVIFYGQDDALATRVATTVNLYAPYRDLQFMRRGGVCPKKSKPGRMVVCEIPERVDCDPANPRLCEGLVAGWNVIWLYNGREGYQEPGWRDFVACHELGHPLQMASDAEFSADPDSCRDGNLSTGDIERLQERAEAFIASQIKHDKKGKHDKNGKHDK